MAKKRQKAKLRVVRQVHKSGIEYILIGFENCTFDNAKDGRFASDPALATIEN